MRASGSAVHRTPSQLKPCITSGFQCSRGGISSISPGEIHRTPSGPVDNSGGYESYPRYIGPPSCSTSDPPGSEK